MISISDAFEFLKQHVSPLKPTAIDLQDSVGRVLATDILADIDSPPHRKSMMDGFAIRSADINAGILRLNVVETIVAGAVPSLTIETGQAARIMTGAPVPDGADAIVMIEQTKTETVDGSDWVSLDIESIASGKHLMERACNFAKSDVVLRSGHRIRPTDVGLLAEVGAASVLVGGMPTAAFLPTGDELVTCDQIPGQGQIRNSNGPMLLAMARHLGLEAIDVGIGRDNVEQLRSSIEQGLKQNLLVLSGGVSAGMLDLVPGILRDAGVEEVFHKVKIKPGKPIWFGVLERPDHRCHVFGLPGNPVSSLVGFQLFVRTAIRILERDPAVLPTSVSATLSERHETRGDRPTYWPGRWVADDSVSRFVKPLIWRGSSDLLSLGSADGLIYFSGENNEHAAGEEVQFYPFG